MATTIQRDDPIGERYFAPLRKADKFSDFFFYITALLSWGALLVEKADHPGFYNFIQGAFILCALGLFAVGQAIRLYFWPRAEDKRRGEFLSNTLGVNLTHERTTGYYNNNETDPIRRMGAAVLENTHFTSNGALNMALGERLQVAVYLAIWLVALMNRNTDLGWIAVAAQAIFSEQLLSKWFKVEWLRIKTEKIHSELRKIFSLTAAPDMLRAHVFEAFATYETAKSNAGIVLSEKLFKSNNQDLSAEWERIKISVNIQ